MPEVSLDMLRAFWEAPVRWVVLDYDEPIKTGDATVVHLT